MEDNPLLLIAFLAMFHIIGAIALGYAARSLWKRLHGDDTVSTFAAVFLVVWGSMFGCMPLIFGTNPILPDWFLPTQLAIWGTAFILSAFYGRAIMRWAKPLSNVHVALMVLGGIFFIAGMGAARVAWIANDVVQAGIFLVVFGGIGLLVFGIGFAGLVRSNR